MTGRFDDAIPASGAHGSRPASGPDGMLYSCTTHSLIYRYTTAGGWVTWAVVGATSNLPPLKGCRLYKAATQTLTTNTETSLAFDTEEYDTDTFHDNVTNNTRITIPSLLGGYYRFHFEAYWNTAPTAPVYWLFKKNGTTEIKGRRRLDTTAITYMSSSVTIPLVATDYVEVRALHVSGANRDVGVAVYETVLEATYLGS